MRPELSEEERIENFTETVIAEGRAAGLDEVGVTDATPFKETRLHLEERREEGLAGEMQFTYRNPARSTDPTRTLPGARSLFVGARRIPAPRLRHLPADSARIAAYARRDYYSLLRKSLAQVSEYLTSVGWNARVLVDDNALVDKAAAVRAGIGWYGKNSNVLLPGRGSWFVLGSVVTDAPLKIAAEPLRDACGSCERCIQGCPTGAIIQPGVVDARRCLAWIAQAPGSIPPNYRVALADRIYGCDDCQEVCPIGDSEREFMSDGLLEDAGISAVWVLEASEEELLERFGHWYIANRDPRYLRRNALVVLGNSEDWDPAVDSLLKRFADSEDMILKEHAEWALEQRHENLMELH